MCSHLVVTKPKSGRRVAATEAYKAAGLDHWDYRPNSLVQKQAQRSGGCSTIIEGREISWSRQHPSRTGPSRWRGCSHRSHNNLQQDFADRRMANPMDPVLNHHASQERQPAAVPELPSNKLHQSSKQSGEDHRRRTGRLQSRKEYHRADLQPAHSM